MPTDSLLSEDPEALSTDDLDDALAELCSHLNAAEYRLLRLIGEWDARGLCGDHGVKSCAHWLDYKCGMNLGAARERVRVARALPELPRIAKLLERGELSYSKVRALTRVATPDNEALLVNWALGATAAQIERIVSSYRRLDRLRDPETVLRQRRERGLQWSWDEDGMLVIRGRFPPEEGGLILRAIEDVRDRMHREDGVPAHPTMDDMRDGGPEPDVECTHAARNGDALVRLVEQGVRSEAEALPGAERTHVVVHVAAEQLNADGSVSRQADTPPPQRDDDAVMLPETIRRLACDASCSGDVLDAEGRTVSIGRRSRMVPHGMQRALRRRDGGCRFPGCTQRTHVDAHHVVHWADGGETSLGNLVLLCRHHHRLVHEEGFDCALDADGAVRFIYPDGSAMPEAHPLRRGAFDDIARLNRRAGLRITPRTCSGGWDGRRVDFGEALAQLWERTKGTATFPVTPRPAPARRVSAETRVPVEPTQVIAETSFGGAADNGVWLPIVNGERISLDPR